MTDIRLEDALAEIEHLNEQCDIFVREINAKAIDNARLRAALLLAADHLASEGYTIEADMARRALEPKP